MKTIIAPTDFSEGSLNAVAYAADLAVDVKASLLLLHIVELPALSGLPVTELTWQQADHEADLIALQQKMLERTMHKIAIDTLQTSGSIQYELKQACRLINPFALVMCTHAPTTLDRLLFGSTTMYSIKHLHYPVINVPPNKAYTPIKKIALATDLKNIYHVPVEDIKSITRFFGASLDIVYVHNTDDEAPALQVEKLILLKRLEDLKPTFHRVDNTCTETGIDAFAIENNINLVILVPHKHSVFRKSESRQVVFHLPLPAMTLAED